MPHSRYFLLNSETNNKKKNLSIPRRNLRNKYNPLEETEERFILKYRLSKEAFVYVLKEINLSEGIRSTYVPPILRLASTLLVLGSGGYQWLASEDINVPINQGSLSLIVNEVVQKNQGRFRILMEERKSRYSPTKMALFSNACAALHNICIHFKVSVDQTAESEEIDDESSRLNMLQFDSYLPAFLKRIGETNRRRITEDL